MWDQLIRQFILCCLFVTIAFAAQPRISSLKDAELDELVQWMTGDFDTFAQVAADETAKANYKHDSVILHVRPVTIKGLSDQATSRTLYLEQAQASTPTQPYRQAVYWLQRAEGKLVNRAYRLKDAAKFVGAYADAARLKHITADQLTLIEGCDLTFTKINDQLYRGATGSEKSCKSTRRGATFMTAHTELTPTATITLDQGFDDAGAHKWGPPPGVIGHIFIKQSHGQQ